MNALNLQISDLSHAYYDVKSGGALPALHRVNLEVHEGEFVAVIGPSGCGKTTLLNVVAGLITPTQGTVVLDGSRVVGPRKDVGLVFQQPLLLPWKTLLGNVAWGLRLRGMSKDESSVKAEDVLKTVGLSGFKEYYPLSLSGGMQQRANLARALAIEPKLLLLDEPFANLDALTREVLQYELAKIGEGTRKTILLVTHEIGEAVYLSDKIYVLTKRPGTVKDIVQIDLPRPRDLTIKRTTHFMDYIARIWDLLELGFTQREQSKVTSP
jgi:NitT/TauT family transport system ATP-binding protein